MSTQVQFKDYSMGFKDDDGKVYNLIDHLNMSSIDHIYDSMRQGRAVCGYEALSYSNIDCIVKPWTISLPQKKRARSPWCS